MIDSYTDIELAKALKNIMSYIHNCEKIWSKFPEGTSQHTLLKNRIKALYISKSLLLQKNVETYTIEELNNAKSPIVSIINKCQKGQMKFKVGTSHYSRFENIIQSMMIVNILLDEELCKRKGRI